MLGPVEIEIIKNEVGAIDVLDAGDYVCGHPEINDSTDVYLAVTDENLFLFQGINKPGVRRPFVLGEIPKKAIKKISIEDKSTIEKKVTVGRVLALGVFAFAFKKKEANEVNFIVIDWVDDKNMEQNTAFKIEGKGAMGKANTLRNTILKYI